ncbi:MAG: tyrosine-type recombinase/integrase [Planctomycetaceae bacterium]|nr:tyrosine-type recombinase/integrase [Planctomycetaceae bacterium]
MGNPNKSKIFNCTYFTWKLFKRGAVYYADGRTNSTNLGKHSLMAKEESEAINNLRLLDRAKAIELGLAQRESVTAESRRGLSLDSGWTKFLDHCDRPAVMGGVSHNTLKRYRAVRTKHVEFCNQQQIRDWSEIGREQTEAYGRWLAAKDYSARSIYLELTLLVSINKWLIQSKLLSSELRFHLRLTKPTGTDTHCYTRQQVSRMLKHCESSRSGRWIRPILVTLATTGMRIGELMELRWRDVDFEAGVVQVVDDRFSGRKRLVGTARTTKGKRSRTIPMNAALMNVLKDLVRHSDGRVFHGPMGARLRQKSVLNVFKRDIRGPLATEFPVPKEEIGFEHGTLHSFRHYFVSECFRQGATEAEIMDWVGHRDSKMVHHYRHLRPDDSQCRMRAINFIEADTGSSSPDSFSTGGAAGYAG